MKKTTWVAVLIIIAIVVGVYFYLHSGDFYPHSGLHRSTTAVPAGATSAAAASMSVAPAAIPEQPHYPVPTTPAAAQPANPAPLPRLDNSDQPFIGALQGLTHGQALDSFLVSKRLIRRIVVTVDDLGRHGPIPLRVRAVGAMPGTLATSGPRDDLVLDPSNAARYAGWVQALKGVDMHATARVYFHFYPLFQAAYRDLGFPHGYFNDRLVQVIDQLLAAPVPPPPIHLVQPHVLYEFADPQLAALSAGQQIMVRIGATNEAIVKAKLRQLRAAVIGGTPAP
ncbi:MAG TPA: DUF3014 domain-containing protein [Nevskiaceae bacterium]|nr:DUF3014 domain-containing protein [Nevskiaceae bacterium]